MAAAPSCAQRPANVPPSGDPGFATELPLERKAHHPHLCLLRQRRHHHHGPARRSSARNRQADPAARMTPPEPGRCSGDRRSRRAGSNRAANVPTHSAQRRGLDAALIRETARIRAIRSPWSFTPRSSKWPVTPEVAGSSPVAPSFAARATPRFGGAGCVSLDNGRPLTQRFAQHSVPKTCGSSGETGPVRLLHPDLPIGAKYDASVHVAKAQKLGVRLVAPGGRARGRGHCAGRDRALPRPRRPSGRGARQGARARRAQDRDAEADAALERPGTRSLLAPAQACEPRRAAARRR